MEEDHKYWLGFSLIPEVGHRRILHLHQAFGSMKAAWHADQQALLRAGLGENLAAQVMTHRAKLHLDRELNRVGKVGAFLLTLADEQYPARLREVDDAPALLYVRGTLTPQDNQAVCIVGTRKATVYGKDAAYMLAKDLAAQGVTIVSGLAQGIDTAAHRGALEAGGRTIAVMGTGISMVYPEENLELARQIISQGAVITEFPIGTLPHGRNFPRRNRIMSGLALGVVVVEAAERSGALITTTTAASQGRDVFAVPNNIFNPAGRGANRLIQDGAKLVISAQDVLDEIQIAHTKIETRVQTEAAAPADATEASLLELLSHDPIHIDDLVRLSGLPVATISSTLTLLELKGLARTVGSMQYSLAP